MKKSISLVIGCLLAFSSTTAYGQMRYYDPDEIRAKAYEKLQQDTTMETGTSIKPFGSVYIEALVGYEPRDSNKKDAFEIAEFTFDTRGEAGSETVMTVSYESGTRLEWVDNGTVSVSASDLFDILEAEASYSIARTSSTNEAVGASKEYRLYTDRIGSINIYAHGVEMKGVLIYEWEDIDGNRGTREENANILAPYKEYSTSKIHFGPVIYE